MLADNIRVCLEYFLILATIMITSEDTKQGMNTVFLSTTSTKIQIQLGLDIRLFWDHSELCNQYQFSTSGIY